MEHGVAEDRARVVVEPDEAREIEALRVVQAEDDAVDERVQEEAGQDRQRRQEEQQVDARLRDASGGAERPGFGPAGAIPLEPSRLASGI